MIDLKTMLKSLRFTWLSRIFSENDGTWKHYLQNLLKSSGALFLFLCNYDLKDLQISSNFYTELFQWWADFREAFSTEKQWLEILWNNKDIRIDKKPIFYKTFFESGVTHVTDLRFDLNTTESYHIIPKNIERTNFIAWAGLRHAIASHLKSNSKNNNHTFRETTPSLIIKNNGIDILRKKSKDYYALLISKKAQLSNNSLVLKCM